MAQAAGPQRVRVIPCLDVKDGRVVKGVKFTHLKDAGTPSTLAEYYADNGADEIAVLDVSATGENRGTRLQVVRDVVQNSAVPVTVGGGIRSVEDVEALLEAGASKVSIGTAAFTNPNLVNEVSSRFGPSVIVVSIDARRFPEDTGNESKDVKFELTTNGGTQGTGVDAIEFAAKIREQGAGALLLNSIDQDGVQEGFDLDLIRQAKAATDAPVIASGGAGKIEDFVEAAEAGADAVLGASVFHYGTVSIEGVKNALEAAGFAIS